MKKSLLPLLLLISISSFAQWVKQTSPNNEDYLSVQFTNLNEGKLLTSDSLLSTSDGGSTWSSHALPFNFSASIIPTATDMCWIDGNIGFICGYRGYCYYTTDGGATITQHSVPDSATTLSDFTKDLNSIHFQDEMVGWVAGKGGRIFHTNDGGHSWTAQSSGTTEEIYDIRFTDINNGWACGHNKILLKTSDGGSTWTTVNTSSLTGSSNFKALWPLNSTHVILTDESGHVYESTDGSTFNTMPFASGSSMFGTNNIWMRTGYGYIVGQGGKVSVYNGVNWTNQTVTPTYGSAQNSVWFVDDTHGWACGNSNELEKFTGTVGISNVETAAINCYPNPANDMLYINATAGEVYTLKIVDMMGQVHETRQAVGPQNIAVDALANAYYFILITNDKGTQSTKVLVQH
jgi:photosystem II stability/assembly factor-like uncharacterized protein